MFRIGPSPTRSASSPTRKSAGSLGLAAYASVRAPKMSPVASFMPPVSLLPLEPPGVVWKMPCPCSWATMSIAVSWRALSELWPKFTIEPL